MSRTPLLFAVIVCLACFAPVAYGQDEGVGGKKWAEWLEILKTDKNVKERRKAIIALEVAGSKVKGVLDGLIEALAKESEADLRRDVAALLDSMGTDLCMPNRSADAKGVVDALGETLKKDKVDKVREAAAKALGRGLNPVADSQVLVLAGALKDAYEGTRSAAAEALRNMGEKAKPALDQIAEVAKNPKTDRYTRLYTIQVVGKWGDALAAPPVLLSIAKETDAQAGIREAAIEGLGRVAQGHMETPAVLSTALQDKNVEIRRAAATALGLIGDKAVSVWPTVKKRLEAPAKGRALEDDAQVRHQLFRAAANVAKTEKDAVLLLLDAAKDDPATENRLAAILELGELGSAAKDILPALTKLANEEARPQLREAAQNSVNKIKAATN